MTLNCDRLGKQEPCPICCELYKVSDRRQIRCGKKLCTKAYNWGKRHSKTLIETRVEYESMVKEEPVYLVKPTTPLGVPCCVCGRKQPLSWCKCGRRLNG